MMNPWLFIMIFPLCRSLIWRRKLSTEYAAILRIKFCRAYNKKQVELQLRSRSISLVKIGDSRSEGILLRKRLFHLLVWEYKLEKGKSQIHKKN